MALRSQGANHILLSGVPASAKTMFLLTLRHHLKDSCFIDGGNTSKAGIIDYLFKSRAPCLLIDEIDKMSPRDQTFLLNLMEIGILTETKNGKTREAEIKTSVFATCKDPRKLSAPLQSRFLIVELEPYTYEQFYAIAVHLLDKDFARIIADAVWNTSRNLRDCVRIGKLASKIRRGCEFSRRKIPLSLIYVSCCIIKFLPIYINRYISFSNLPFWMY